MEGKEEISTDRQIYTQRCTNTDPPTPSGLLASYSLPYP